MKPILSTCLVALSVITLNCCTNGNLTRNNTDAGHVDTKDSLKAYVNDRVNIYEKVTLTADLDRLSENERKMIPLLIKAAQLMDTLFWRQAYPQHDSLLTAVQDENTRRFIHINYGPWDRLNNDKPFVAGIGPRPPGAGFYPVGMTKEELEASDIKKKRELYSVIRRDAQGKLTAIPYHIEYKPELEKAAGLLNQAAELADDPGLKKYLLLRAKALVTSDYTASDYAWMDMKSNNLDIIIGPIENYEDKLLNARASFEAYVLIKDREWSKRLEKYVAMLPELQRGLPVDARYKSEVPGTESELNAYDIIYYAGDCNAGSKTIAVNLPNDEKIQQEKGTRRSQLKNAMRAKFDKIMVPIAEELIDSDQIKYVKFDAFFSNVMFHEVAHGLGIKSTVNGKGFVREALAEQSSWLEEGKADILGLYMVSNLLKKGDLEGEIKDYYTTFMAGILRSVRFGASSAHGKANMQCFNFFREKGAFQRTKQGKYRVNYEKFAIAMNDLGREILILQGNGDRLAVERLGRENGLIPSDLKSDLESLVKKGIPVDIVFEQGLKVLDLK
ncbi:MAG TPA: Zn-dependent hydrolase [Sphingobacteriaceae bacterium]